MAQKSQHPESTYKRTKKPVFLNASKISMYFGREEMIKLKRHELV